MRRRLIVLTALAAAFAAAQPQRLLAQDAQAPPQGERLVHPTPKLFDVDFRGGTMAEYVEAVRRANPEASIVLSPDAVGLPVPAMQLRQVDMSTAFMVASESGGMRQSGKPGFWVSPHHVRGASSQTIVVSRSPEQGDRTRSNVWSVSEHIAAGAGADDVLSAVETMASVVEADATIRFHEATGLLIVRGTSEQLTLINEGLSRLLDALRRRADEGRALNRANRDIAQHVEREAIELAAQERIAAKRIELAQARVAQVDVMYPASFDEAEHKVQKLLREVELAEAEAQLDTIRRNLALTLQTIQRLRESE